MTIIKTDAKCPYCGKRGLVWHNRRKKKLIKLVLMDGEWEHRCDGLIVGDPPQEEDDEQES